MQITRKRFLAFLGGVGLVGGFLFDLLWEFYGQVLPEVPWMAMIGMLVLSAVLVVLGLPVKEWRDGNRKKHIDFIKAAKVAVMAKSAAYAGAFLAGWYAGAAAYLLTSGGGVRTVFAFEHLIPIPVALVLMITGVVIESYCQLPPDDPKGTASA